MLKYLDVDSTHRNRKEFPNPAQFNLLSQQKSNAGSIEAVDPVSLETPIVTYRPKDIGILVYSSIPESRSNSSIDAVFWFPTSLNPSHISNYYRGCEIIVQIATVDIGRVVVDTWDYLSTTIDQSTTTEVDLFRVTYSPPIDSLQFPLIDNIRMVAPTRFSIGLGFIPSGSLTSQVYKDWFIWNENRKEGSSIISYDGTNAIASANGIPTWTDNNTISLRRNLPLISNKVVLSGSTHRIIKTNIISEEPRIYIGDFLRISQTNISIQNEIRRIIDYDNYGNFTIDSPLSSIPPNNTDIEILQFSYDNFKPLVYTGTNLSNDSCYEVQLIHLILPNLGVVNGGVVQSYPYFYVEFQNYSTSGGGTRNIIYSNNPVSNNKLFKVPVTDISPPSLNSFVTLDKCYMSQLIKLLPNSNFKFGVYLPDGTPFQTTLLDTVSPSAPNENVQISALFSLRRVS